MKTLFTFAFWISTFSILAAQATRPVSPGLSLDTDAVSLELVAEGLISTAHTERDFALSPNRKLIVFTRGNALQTLRALVAVSQEGKTWGQAYLLPFSGEFQDIEPFFSPDGKRLYFASNRPLEKGGTPADYNIWWVEYLENNKWGVPQAVGAPVNTAKNEFFPAVARNGNLYFTTTYSDNPENEDIFLSRWVNGAYEKPVPLDSAVNTATYEFNAYVSPDEDLIVFSSYGRPDDLGGGDLYLCRKSSDGNWLPTVHLKAPVNSDKLDYCPFVDLSQNLLYFTSNRASRLEKRLSSIEELQQELMKTLNGLGNIYRVKLED